MHVGYSIESLNYVLTFIIEMLFTLMIGIKSLALILKILQCLSIVKISC
jgi:hypothetical protein